MHTVDDKPEVEVVYRNASGGSEAACSSDACVVHHYNLHGHCPTNVDLLSASRHQYGSKHGSKLQDSSSVTGAFYHNHCLDPHSALRPVYCPLCERVHG